MYESNHFGFEKLLLEKKRFENDWEMFVLPDIIN